MTTAATTFSEQLLCAIEAVRQAGETCQRIQARLVNEDTLQKKDKSPVTVADFASQAIICHILGEAFPGIPVVGEEDATELRQEDQKLIRETVIEEVRKQLLPLPGQTEEKLTSDNILSMIDRGGFDPLSDTEQRSYWCLDPIDGTKGFMRGEQYAVALALIENGELKLGVLGCPNLPLELKGAGKVENDQDGGTLMFAEKGKGTWQLPMRMLAQTPATQAVREADAIRVSDALDLSSAAVCESVESAHTRHSESAVIAERLGITAEPVRLDSQCKYATVARGDACIYLRLPTRPGYEEKIWDHGAGVLCVLEAGGQVTDVHGQTLDFDQGRTLKKNHGAIATHGRHHEPITQVVQDVLS